MDLLRGLRALAVVTVIVIGGLAVSACSDDNHSVPGAVIDFVDFVRLGDVMYLRMHPVESAKLAESDLGPEYDRVRFTLQGNVRDSSYRSKDGDAAYLAEGTRLFEVRGYRPEFLLAVQTDGIVLYEANSVDGAETGADLLDIGGGRVEVVGIYSLEGDGTLRLGLIDDSAQVEGLVEAILSAPIDPADPMGLRYGVALVFEMNDGLSFRRVYSISHGELQRDIRLPESAQRVIAGAMESGPAP